MKVEIKEIGLSGVDFLEILNRSPVRDVKNAGRTLHECMRISAYIFVGKADGQVACIWGLIPPTLLSDQAFLWLLHTDLVHEHQFTFVRQSQRVMETMLRRYKVIVGNCIVGEDKSIRWLKWLGAKFGDPQGNKVPFVIRAKNG